VCHQAADFLEVPGMGQGDVHTPEHVARPFEPGVSLCPRRQLAAR
jgi:hypothetical protein